MDAIPTEDTARYADMFGALGAECRLRIVRLLWAGCIAGALDENDYRARLEQPGSKLSALSSTRV